MSSRLGTTMSLTPYGALNRNCAVIEENNEGAETADTGSSLAGQLLSALQLTQDVTLQFVSAWFDGASEVVTKLTELAVQPVPSVVPPAPELLTFVQGLHASQQAFFNDLVVKADPVSFIGSLKAAQVALLAKPADVAAQPLAAPAPEKDPIVR